MKNFTEMKFGEYTFMHNPKTLSVENRLIGKKQIYPFSGSHFSALSLDNAVISGKGLITGDGCFQKLLRLLSCIDGRSRLLSISPFPSVAAVLTSLEYTLNPGEHKIEIDFSFTCSSAAADKDDMALSRSIEVTQRDTLWDIGYKYGVAVEELLRLNTFVKRADELKDGWVIRLC